MPLGPRSQSSNGAPRPTYMSDQQMGQHHSILKTCTRKVRRASNIANPPTGDFLNNLRTNRVPRPNGSRPPPQSSIRSRTSQTAVYGTLHSAQSAISIASTTDRTALRSSSGVSNRRVSGRTVSGGSGKDVALQYTSEYFESEERRREREEAYELRVAMEKLDMEEDLRVHRAAKEEAMELMQEHERDGVRERSPEECNELIGGSSLVVGRRRTPPLIGAEDTLETKKEHDAADITSGNTSNYDTERLESSGQTQSYSTLLADTTNRPDTVGFLARRPTDDQPLRLGKQRSSSKLSQFSITNLTNRRKSSGSRRVSGTRQTSLFANPEDKIYEDPVDVFTAVKETAEEPQVQQSIYMRRNPFVRAQSTRKSGVGLKTPFASKESLIEKPDSNPIPALPNHLSKQRTPESATKDSRVPQETTKEENFEQVKFRNGMEIRSEDIVSATTKMMRDRSPRLSMPTVGTASPQRPIVSFDEHWSPPAQRFELPGLPTVIRPQRPALGPRIFHGARNMDPAKSFSAPIVPTLEHPCTLQSGNVIPTFNIGMPEANGSLVTKSTPSNIPLLNTVPDIPSITIDESPTTPGDDISISRFPLPPSITINVDAPTTEPAIRNTSKASKPHNPLHHLRQSNTSRPHPHHSSSAPTRTSLPHWTPSIRRQTSQCSSCGLPISGRIVTASNARFHPECFNCYHCQTPLECVAFYPEPESHRAARLARAEGTAQDLDQDATVQEENEDDGDRSPRFYCHLDFHESFSPRCKSCKTPIEGEVILACGAEWHEGHFFCAQCGDPFDATTPNYIEKDGYAWCIACHTNRVAPKCRRCRRPVVDMCIEALGAQWCEGCFVCTICNAPFPDGRYFLHEPVAFNTADANANINVNTNGKGKGKQKQTNAGPEPVCFHCEASRLKS